MNLPGPQIGRLAIRVEGECINAYYASPGTMHNAILLATIPRDLAGLAGTREAFVTLGRHMVGEMIFDVTGVRPVWGELEKGPEHERAGAA